MSAQRGFVSIHLVPLTSSRACRPSCAPCSPGWHCSDIVQVQVKSTTWLDNLPQEVLSQVRKSICMYVPVRPQTHPPSKKI